MLLKSLFNSSEIFANDGHVPERQSEMPEYPHSEYDHARRPGEVGVAMEGQGQDIPSKLDLYQSLADESSKYEPRKSPNSSVGIPAIK